MFGKVPAYTDIAHFRSPYENSVISGFGQTPAPPPPPELTEEAIVDTSEEGYRTLKPSVQKLVMDTLTGAYAAVHMGGEYNNAQLVPFTAEEMQLASTNPDAAAILRSRSAGTWVEQQLKDDQVVFAAMPTVMGLMSGQALAPGADQLGTFPKGSVQAKEAAKSPMGVVLAGDPEGGVTIAGLNIGLIAVGVILVGGAAYMAMRKKKGGAGGMAMPTSL